jgi:hypothetical protein
MILLTRTQRAQLLANGRQRGADHVPVVKFFNPFGAGVWLATELDEDGDVMFGLADIGCPELGSWSLEELRGVRLPFGMGIERDLRGKPAASRRRNEPSTAPVRHSPAHPQIRKAGNPDFRLPALWPGVALFRGRGRRFAS